MSCLFLLCSSIHYGSNYNMWHVCSFRDLISCSQSIMAASGRIQLRIRQWMNKYLLQRGRHCSRRAQDGFVFRQLNLCSRGPSLRRLFSNARVFEHESDPSLLHALPRLAVTVCYESGHWVNWHTHHMLMATESTVSIPAAGRLGSVCELGKQSQISGG